jgi:glycosyltransferase involved in cell wall biosynthesis
VVPSGVDALYWSDDRDLWAREQGVSGIENPSEPPASSRREGILCVSRFDPQKGQHRLIEALRPLCVPLTLVGSDNPNYPGYRALCRKRAGPETTILPRQSLGRLRNLFHSCRVHALVSWYELSGLSALEAGACGARVVTTNRGGMRDYCGDLAWYANPAELVDIRRAVEQALSVPQTPNLADRVRSYFTWEHSARSLHQVYIRVLANRLRAAA